MMFSLGPGLSMTIPPSTLKLHGVFGDEPKEDQRWSHQPALMMSNSMMMEQQKKAVIEHVRSSLKGLCNEAPSWGWNKIFLQVSSIESNGAKIKAKKLDGKEEGSKLIMWSFSRCVVVVVHNPSFDEFKLQITNTAEEAVLLSSSCSPSDACRQDCKFRVTNHKLQITTLQVSNYKFQRRKELTKSWLQMAMKASSSMKLLKRRKMRKTQKKPTKLTSIKKKLESKESSQWRSQRSFRTCSEWS